MTFNNLENSLSDENISLYLGLFESLQKPTKDILGYTLDIASYLNLLGLKEEYGLFGGYAVLSHLMQHYGIDVAKTWRGSTDIDMVGSQKVINSLRSEYDIISDFGSPNIKEKRTLKIRKGKKPLCKIDFSSLKILKQYGEFEENRHFGIPLKVLHPKDIIRGKIYIPLGEQQHLGDILGMLSVLEKREYPPKKVSVLFDRKEKKEFYMRFKYAEEFFGKDRLGFFPSKAFSRELKKDLSKKIFD